MISGAWEGKDGCCPQGTGDSKPRLNLTLPPPPHNGCSVSGFTFSQTASCEERSGFSVPWLTCYIQSSLPFYLRAGLGWGERTGSHSWHRAGQGLAGLCFLRPGFGANRSCPWAFLTGPLQPDSLSPVALPSLPLSLRGTPSPGSWLSQTHSPFSGNIQIPRGWPSSGADPGSSPDPTRLIR